jgi:hypothetical protein
MYIFEHFAEILGLPTLVAVGVGHVGEGFFALEVQEDFVV